MNIWSFPIYSMACWLTVWLVGAGNGWLYFVAFASLLCCYRCTRCPHAHKYIFLSFFFLFFHSKTEDFQIFQHFFSLAIFKHKRYCVTFTHKTLGLFSNYFGFKNEIYDYFYIKFIFHLSSIQKRRTNVATIFVSSLTFRFK